MLDQFSQSSAEMLALGVAFRWYKFWSPDLSVAALIKQIYLFIKINVKKYCVKSL